MDSYVVYAPVDAYAMTELINGGNPDDVAILPSGFSILPDKPMHQDETGGSLLTIAFHIALGASTEHMPPDQHLNVLHRILETTVSSIKEGLEYTIQRLIKPVSYSSGAVIDLPPVPMVVCMVEI